MTTTTNNCGSCGNCRENGRLWVEGYHGKNSLNFTTDAALIQNVAAFHDYGFNLSECCAPVIKATPKNITDLLLKPVVFSESRLTTDLNDQGFILDDTTLVTSTGTPFMGVNFNAIDLDAGFEVFFADTTVCGDLTVDYTVDVANAATDDDAGPFTVTVKISFKKGAVELASYTLVSNAFSISAAIIPVYFTPVSVGTTLVLGDSILTFTQFPTFSLEGFVDGGIGFADKVTLRLTNHLYTSCKQNTLSAFLVCNDASNCAG